MFVPLTYFFPPSEFYEPMPPYSGNKTNLFINATATLKPSSQSFASATTLPQSSTMTFRAFQHLTAPLTSSSPQSLISSLDSTLLQQTSPTNHLPKHTSDSGKTDFPQAATEKTSSLSLPPPLVSVAQSTLLHRLTSSTKRTPEQLQTLPTKGESPQRLSVATEMISSRHLTLSHDNREPTAVQQSTTTVKLSSSQDVTPVSLWQKTLPLNVTRSQEPFSGQSGENEKMQYFKGSFSLVNETYHPQYSDSMSDDFRGEALKLENMVSIVLDIVVTCALKPAPPLTLAPLWQATH